MEEVLKIFQKNGDLLDWIIKAGAKECRNFLAEESLDYLSLEIIKSFPVQAVSNQTFVFGWKENGVESTSSQAILLTDQGFLKMNRAGEIVHFKWHDATIDDFKNTIGKSLIFGRNAESDNFIWNRFISVIEEVIKSSEQENIDKNFESRTETIVSTSSYSLQGFSNSSSSYSWHDSKSLMDNVNTDINENMAIDKSIIEYVIGIDLGHGETSAAICPMQWDKLDDQLDAAKDLEMEPNRKVIPSAITMTADGTAKIGTAAFDPNILKKAKVNVCFKKKPIDMSGAQEQLMMRFMKEVYRKIRENNGGMLTDTNHLVYIATPSGWDKDAQNLYLEMARKAGIPMGGITKESRAAFIRAQHDPTANLGRNIEKGAIVFDMGSSTLDFTYHNAQLDRMIDNGYDCGASFVEKSMFTNLEKSNEAIQNFRAKYPDLVDYLLFEVRKAKEDIYFDTSRKYKKTINFEDFIDDEDLEDDRFRLKFEAGELTQFLESNGYVGSIRAAMHDYITNHISGQNIYGVFLTGGASRMDFIKTLVAQCWNIPEDKIFRDQDPSLTISQGVAEVARIDLRTHDLNKDLEPLFKSVTGNQVYNSFVDIFGEFLYENITDSVANKIIEWRDASYNRSLNQLNWGIKTAVKTTVQECSSRVNEGINAAINEETKELREKVDAIVNAYTKQGANIQLPSLTDLEVNADTGIDMDGVLTELSSSIETESSNWGGIIAGAGIGAAVAMILGGPLAWIIGGGALLGKWLFCEDETEEQKRNKAMSKDLSSDERMAVFNQLSEKWDSITESIKNSIYNSLNGNSRARRDVSNSVNNLMSAYKDTLKKSRIMVE